MEAVAVYSDADAAAAHVRLADVAVRIGPPPPTESYLRIDAIVEAARATGAEAIHPGYGFLAERAAFARAVEDAGLVFVGPPSASIDALGDKLHARRTARDGRRRGGARDARAGAGRPAGPGRRDPRGGRGDRLPAAGQGGRRRGRARHATGRDARATCRRRWPPDRARPLSAFGDGSVYLEREIVPARHIEVQLLGDATRPRRRASASGTARSSGATRSSSRRRRRPGLTARRAARTCTRMAVRVATAAGLRNAATAEFLRSPDGSFYFLEVNTRLQVEHGVTELVSGLDIVREQFWLAAGRPLSDERAGRRRAGGRPGRATPSRSGSPPRIRPATSPRRRAGSAAG